MPYVSRLASQAYHPRSVNNLGNPRPKEVSSKVCSVEEGDNSVVVRDGSCILVRANQSK